MRGVPAIQELLRQSPEVETTLFDGKVRIVHLYRKQLKAFLETADLPRPERISTFVQNVLEPHLEYWSSFFNRERFIEWMDKNLVELGDLESPGIQLPFNVSFDSLFETTARKLRALTSKPVPESTWYLLYRSESNMGGLTNGIMFVHLLNLGKAGMDHLRFLLPHEINHQVFRRSNGDGRSLLARIVDEGLACYVNYLYWDRSHTPAKNIDFTEDEWDWSIANEGKVWEYARKYLESTDRDVVDRFGRWHQYLWDGTPDRMAYFIGFRVCESYVREHGPNSWRDIYDFPVARTLEKSGYERFIGGR